MTEPNGEPRAGAEATGGRQPPAECLECRTLPQIVLYRTELAHQNEALRSAQLEIEAARDRYRSLFDVAPVGYLTLDEGGFIEDANLAAAALLGRACRALVLRPLAAFMFRPDVPAFYRLLWEVTRRQIRHDCSLRFVVDGEPRTMRVVAAATPPRGAGAVVRVALVDLSELLAARAALSVSEDELRAAMERLLDVHDDERQHLARELHDGTAQALVSLAVGLEQIRSAPSLEAARHTAAVLQLVVEEVSADLGRMARGLHPQQLDHLGLEAAVSQLAREHAALHRQDVELELGGLAGAQVPPRAARAAFRILQEALANVAKHAGARRVAIAVGPDGDRLRAVIDDDGRGFDLGATAGGLGLTSMRERARHLGGELDVTSALGRGTTVTAVLPLEAP